MFVKESISSIQSLLGRKHQKIKTACDAASEAIDENFSDNAEKKPFVDPLKLSVNIQPEEPSYASVLLSEWLSLSNTLLEPFLLACECSHFRLAELSLEAIAKLVDGNFVQGSIMSKSVLERTAKCLDRKTDIICTNMLSVYEKLVTNQLCDVHGQLLILVIRLSYMIVLTASDPSATRATKGKLCQIVHVLFERLETVAQKPHSAEQERPNLSSTYSLKKLNSPALDALHKEPFDLPKTDPQSCQEKKPEELSSDQLPDINLHQDTFLFRPYAKIETFSETVFRDCYHAVYSICNLGTKPINIYSNSYNFEVYSRLLSLELVNSIFDGFLPRLKNVRFINLCVKRLLVKFFLVNATSPVYAVFKLAIPLCTLMIKEFRSYLKPETEAVLGHVYIPILASTSAQHCIVILQSLYNLFKIPQCLIDIFINYDCDVASESLVEQLLRLCSVHAKQTSKLDISEQEQAVLTRVASMAIISSNKSLETWCKPLYVPLRSDPLQPEGSSLANHSSLPSDQFREQKSFKQLFQKGKAVFSESPKQGLEYFYEHEMCSRSPESTAEFLFSAPGLDRMSIGQFLAAVSSSDVLDHYARLMDFKNLELDVALRKFFNYFHLPGESQQISRIVEAFSSVYYAQNSNSSPYAHSDAVFFLSMAIVMLSTCLHNPAVPSDEKLTRASWKLLTAGQNANKDFDSDLLDAIFDRINQEGFKDASVYSNSRHRHNNFASELSCMYARAIEALSTPICPPSPSSHAKYSRFSYVPFSSSKDPSYSCDVFSTCFHSFHSTYRHVLEASDPKLVHSCLGGLSSAVRVSCTFDFKAELESLVQIPGSYASLDTVKEMSPKNIECIKWLINIAQEDRLHHSWKSVLKCSSFLELLRSIDLSRLSAQKPYPSPDSTAHPNILSIVQSLTAYRPDQDKSSPAQSILHQIHGISSDRVYTNSALLSDRSFVEFVECLCELSREELFLQKPQLYSLQKLVEVLDFNMNRSRSVWAELWKFLSNHFIEAGTHPSKEVSLVAIDSLRQVVSKLLDRHQQSPGIFDFQLDLLTLFELMYQSENHSVTDYLLCCIVEIITVYHQSIGVGWKPLFNVLGKASRGPSFIAESALNLLNSIVDQYLDSVVNGGAFSHYIECISQFAHKTVETEKAARQAVQLLSCCASRLRNSPAEDPAHSRLWVSIVKGILPALDNPLDNVRSQAVSTLFDILATHGHLFPQSLWNSIFDEALFPLLGQILDPPSLASFLSNDSDWLVTTYLKFFHSIVLLFVQYFSQLSVLLPQLLQLLLSIVLQEDEKLPRLGMTCLEMLLQSNTKNFDEPMWSSVVETVVTIMQRTLFSSRDGQLHTDSTGAPNSIDSHEQAYKSTICKALIHNLALKIVKDYLVDDHSAPHQLLIRLPDQLAIKLLNAYLLSFLHAFHTLKSPSCEKYMHVDLYTLILKQETVSLKTYIDMIFFLYEHLGEQPCSLDAPSYRPVLTVDLVMSRLNHPTADTHIDATFVASRVFEFLDTLRHFHLLLCTQSTPSMTYRRTLHETNEFFVIWILHRLNSLNDAQFCLFLPHIYPSIALLSQSNQPNVQKVVLTLLVRIGTLQLHIDPSTLQTYLEQQQINIQQDSENLLFYQTKNLPDAACPNNEELPDPISQLPDGNAETR
ncbi:brefeldin A-inhibited guanine nucleotide-exchange protein 2-like [Schistocerca gregaria]|uniref:brefeldin A-inhibited guanine nucleotide-exchange protein 2-like n=1 Tax=Schistocerca gregaria TaxID=7010 RepID=UPI00211EF4C2|nr:brefeldin A-inhibited guanine nucleotide-exchange protein 2-like [Schistocerca gregaria]